MRMFLRRFLRTFFWFILIAIISVPLGVYYFEYFSEEEVQSSVDPFEYNSFVHPDGLFKFDYQNNFEVYEVEDVYFLKDLNGGEVVFQIFENDRRLDFDPKQYDCRAGACYSLATPDVIARNIEIPATKPAGRYEFLTRAEAIKWVYDLRFPDEDFSKYAADCFDDVLRGSESSGYICFAKSQGTVVGIENKFHPDNSINLYGLLKFLFLIFEEQDRAFEMARMDESMFELMSEYHFAYELIAKGYYEGLYLNTFRSDIWPNRHVYKDEAAYIIDNFLAWRRGKLIKNYRKNNHFSLDDKIYVKDSNLSYEFKEVASTKFDSENLVDVDLIQQGESLDLYYSEDGNFYEYLHSFEDMFKSDIEDVLLDFGPDRIEGDVKFSYKNGDDMYFELDVDGDDFEYLKSKADSSLDDENLLPNSVGAGPSGVAPEVQIYMTNTDFENLFAHRTTKERYPAYIELVYPDGSVVGHSVVIKTRGNATRGYTKSSFTVESFDDFKENENFAGDGFIDDIDEFKLRSFINDETMIKEKVFYEGWADLGYPAPGYFEATVELNGMPMGLYQVTEPLKMDFFKSRNIAIDSFYYALNRASNFVASLSLQKDKRTTLDHYELKGDEDADKLMSLINRLDSDDPSLIDEIDIQNVFDYALYVFITSSTDSIEHNYFLYFDEAANKWHITFWDGDTTFLNVYQQGKENFKSFTQDQIYASNNLIKYVFRHIDDVTFDSMYEDFYARFNENVKMVEQVDSLLEKYGSIFEWDNALWNGKYLERNVHYYDTPKAIEEFRLLISNR